VESCKRNESLYRKGEEKKSIHERRSIGVGEKMGVIALCNMSNTVILRKRDRRLGYPFSNSLWLGKEADPLASDLRDLERGRARWWNWKKTKSV